MIFKGPLCDPVTLGSPSPGAAGTGTSWDRDQLQGVSADGRHGVWGLNAASPGGCSLCGALQHPIWVPSLGTEVCAGTFAVVALRLVSNSCTAKGRYWCVLGWGKQGFNARGGQKPSCLGFGFNVGEVVLLRELTWVSFAGMYPGKSWLLWVVRLWWLVL